MSPYRVEVLLDDNKTVCVLAAMLSVHKGTGRRFIHIVRKEMPELLDSSEYSHKSVAHTMTTKRNSCWLRCYEIIKPEKGRKYEVFTVDTIYADFIGKDYIQSNCLTLAMQHYCLSSNYKILSTL